MGNYCQCGQNSDISLTITPNIICEQLTRVRMSLEQVSNKKQRDLREQSKLLTQLFSKDISQRSRMTQKAMISRTVYLKHIIMIYKMLINESKSLLDRRGLLDNPQLVESLFPSINTLLYCSTFLKEDQLNRLSLLIRQRYPNYPQPQDSSISNNLMKYHRYTEQVLFQMENTFIMQYSYQYNITVQKINQVGHQYGYAAGLFHYQM